MSQAREGSSSESQKRDRFCESDLERSGPYNLHTFALNTDADADADADAYADAD